MARHKGPIMKDKKDGLSKQHEAQLPASKFRPFDHLQDKIEANDGTLQPIKKEEIKKTPVEKRNPNYG